MLQETRLPMPAITGICIGHCERRRLLARTPAYKKQAPGRNVQSEALA